MPLVGIEPCRTLQKSEWPVRVTKDSCRNPIEIWKISLRNLENL